MLFWGKDGICRRVRLRSTELNTRSLASFVSLRMTVESVSGTSCFNKKDSGKGQMAPKKVQTSVKLQIEAGKATPAPPVGPALGQAQINIMEFCKQFNARTSNKEMAGLIIPVVITVYTDRSFTFITKTPPASVLLKRAAGIAKGSGAPNKDKVGKVTEKQVADIAKQKMPDLNAASLETAIKSVKGTARSMGIDVVG